MTAPLIPDNIDLRDFAYMPLDVVRLRDSDFTALTSAEAFRSGLLLWCAAWHQVPAGSLPADDRVLSNLAGYGRVVKEWLNIKDEALHGWVLCEDGRYYHPVICEKAQESWAGKQRHHYAKFADRLRKANKKLEESGLPPAEIPTIELWIAAGSPAEWQTISEDSKPNSKESGNHSTGNKNNSAGNPAENALKGKGEVRDRERDNISLEKNKKNPDGFLTAEQASALWVPNLEHLNSLMAERDYPPVSQTELADQLADFNRNNHGKGHTENQLYLHLRVWIVNARRKAQVQPAAQKPAKPAKQQQPDHSQRQTESPVPKNPSFDDRLDWESFGCGYTVGQVRENIQEGETPEKCLARLIKGKVANDTMAKQLEREAGQAAQREAQQRAAQAEADLLTKQQQRQPRSGAA